MRTPTTDGDADDSIFDAERYNGDYIHMTKYTVEVTESIDYERDDDDRTLVDCLTDGERSVWWNSEDGDE